MPGWSQDPGAEAGQQGDSQHAAAGWRLQLQTHQAHFLQGLLPRGGLPLSFPLLSAKTKLNDKPQSSLNLQDFIQRSIVRLPRWLRTVLRSHKAYSIKDAPRRNNQHHVNPATVQSSNYKNLKMKKLSAKLKPRLCGSSRQWVCSKSAPRFGLLGGQCCFLRWSPLQCGVQDRHTCQGSYWQSIW